MTGADKRRWATPIGLTLATTLSGDLDGAWWPHTASMARELAELIEALEDPLGQVVESKSVGRRMTAYRISTRLLDAVCPPFPDGRNGTNA